MTFELPAGWLRIRTVDAHAAGEPLRIVTDGYPDVPGATMLAKRRHARAHLDGLRRVLMLEPRGHADMYGCVLTPPVTPDGDVGVLFLHNEGYSTMCGHGIIALVTVGLETGLIGVPVERAEVRIDTPAGRIVARAERAGGRVRSVSFRNVPSFALALDREVEVDGLGRVRFDLAYGGAFYAYVEAQDVGLELVPASFARVVDVGMRIKHAVARSTEIAHPSGDADLGFLYGTILVQRLDGVRRTRNVCVFADGEVDRSPTGTGVSGRAALHHARGEVALGETLTVESLIGTTFDVRAVEETRVGDLPAIVPEVTGSAHVTGRHEFVVDPGDPLRDGFLLR